MGNPSNPRPHQSLIKEKKDRPELQLNSSSITLMSAVKCRCGTQKHKALIKMNVNTLGDLLELSKNQKKVEKLDSKFRENVEKWASALQRKRGEIQDQ